MSEPGASGLYDLIYGRVSDVDPSVSDLILERTLTGDDGALADLLPPDDLLPGTDDDLDLPDPGWDDDGPASDLPVYGEDGAVAVTLPIVEDYEPDLPDAADDEPDHDVDTDLGDGIW